MEFALENTSLVKINQCQYNPDFKVCTDKLKIKVILDYFPKTTLGHPVLMANTISAC